MSTLAQIRAAIVALHRAVPDVGIVHDRERYLRTEEKFRELYLFTPAAPAPRQVRGWWWRRAATDERTVTIATSLAAHTWQCRGYMAFNDEAGSELVFDALIEALRDAVRADPTLGGVCAQNPHDDGDGTDGVQVVDAGPVTFCGVLCHSAVLQLRTWSYL